MIVSRKAYEEAVALLLPYWPDELSTAHPLDKERVTIMYRLAARHLHPDRGGSAEAFAAVDRAKHVLLHWLARAEAQEDKPHGGVSKCPRCDGRGYMELRNGFKAPLRKQCPTCNGNGEIFDEKDKDGDRL